MSFIHTRLLDAALASIAAVTPAVDMTLLPNGSIQFTLDGMNGTVAATAALQGSNAVPPNGAMPGQPGGWEPPESSWVPLVDGTGTAITATFDGNKTKLLGMPAASLLTRWARGKWTPTSGTGGALGVDVFAHDLG